jgi:DMSO/TMAO reductase YedYZ molybdopterin-dependent catalytic subunit
LARFDRVAANVLDRRAGTTRRQFLSAAGHGAVLALTLFGAGPQAAARGLFGRGLLPSAWLDIPDSPLPKPGMIVHGGPAFNGEFPPHLLDDPITPTARHFVRNNGGIPERARSKDLNGWLPRVDGEVRHPLALTLEDLLCLPQVTMQAVLECAGNGRSLFTPPVGGTPWMRGAVACSDWTGVRLRDVLELAGMRDSAVHVAAFGEDPALDGGEPFSRSIPIGKALDEHTLIALAMNGEPLPAAHGFPARLLVPGWIGSAMQKWLNRLWVRDREHDSAKMSGYSYRLPAFPVAPGAVPPAEDMRVATAWVVKSLITRPRPEREVAVGETLQAGGHAWAGEDRVARVLVSTDFGITWQETRLTPPANRYAWYHWQTEVAFGNRGYYEIWARAFDHTGNAQPFRQPWNPKGYLGNVVHRVPVLVAPKA